MNTRKNSFFSTPSHSPHRDFMKKGRLTRAGGDLARKINFMIHNPQKLVHMQRRALAAESDYVRKIASSQSSSSLSFSADAREKGAVPLFFLTHRPHTTANSLPSVPRQRWVPNRGKQTAAPLSSDRGTGRERSFYIEKAHSARRFPLKDIACVLFAQTKDAKIVCIIAVGPDFFTHNLKRLASARHLIERKLYSYQIARFKQTSQWRRKSWWCILPAALILWHAGSDVMGCRRPTGGVFKYVSSDTSHAEAFPVATPRGRSSSSHGGEQAFNICFLQIIHLHFVS